MVRNHAEWCGTEKGASKNLKKAGVWFARAKQAQPKVGPWATQTFRKMRSCIQKFKPPRCIGEASSNSFFKKEFALVRLGSLRFALVRIGKRSQPKISKPECMVRVCEPIAK